MTDKEIIIDGIKYFKQSDINKGLDEEHYVTEFHLLATHYNLLLEDYARKYNSLKEQLQTEREKVKELEEQLSIAKEGETVWMNQYKLAHQKRVKSDIVGIKYKQVLDEIEEFANKACESCKNFFPNFQSDINCTCCQPSLILGIINKAKGNN